MRFTFIAAAGVAAVGLQQQPSYHGLGSDECETKARCILNSFRTLGPIYTDPSTMDLST